MEDQATPISPSSQTKSEFTVKFGRHETRLLLSEIGVSWSLRANKNSVLLEWSDVLRVTPVPEGCKKPQGPGIELSYISRAKKNWRKETRLFNTSDEQQATKIVEVLSQNVKDRGADRPQNLLVFINPKSGGSKGVSIYQKVAHLFEHAGIKTEVLVTERAGHIIDHIKQTDISGYDGIVIVGGDGTITEAMSGLALASCMTQELDSNDPSMDLPYLNHRIGVIPAGTGQGMATMATGSVNLESCALNIIKGASWNTDLYTAHSGHNLVRTGCLLFAYGFFAHMIKKSEENRQLGKFRYPYAVLASGFKPRPFFCDVDILVSSENGNTEWINRSGEYVSIGHWFVDVMTLEDYNGYLHLGLTSKASIFTIGKTLMPMITRKPLSRLPDCYDYHHAICYKIKPYSGGKQEGSGSESQASNSTSNTTPEPPAQDKLPYDYVNCDGDVFRLPANDVQIKIHPRRIRMFGCHPSDTTTSENSEESEEGATGP